jgi:mRNA interferase HigB
MRVIAKPALIDFWTLHPAAKEPLAAWYRIMRRENFQNFSEVRKAFASADYVEGFTVFDIGGNKFRLIAVIRYEWQTAYIRAVLTHKEYDKGAWKGKPK